MVRPIYYLQTDTRWKNHDYSAKGEKKTIGSAGCGPTAAAMVIATLQDKNVTPVTTALWSMAHAYKALNQGTYYSYFVPQMSAYGITCKRLNTSNLYGKSSSAAHTEALNALKNGDWVIACMGKGNWTSSGHFILLYGYENGYVYINDPASTKAARVKNTWALFARQVKYMWTVPVPDAHKNPGSSSSAAAPSSDSSTGGSSAGASSTGASAVGTSSTGSSSIGSSSSGGGSGVAGYSRAQFIKDVQVSLGAKADGIAGPETLSKTATVSRSKNNRHAVVKPLQRYLSAQGYPAGTADGVAGAKFDAAVKAYQKAHGCIADGEVTAKKNTWKSLLGLR